MQKLIKTTKITLALIIFSSPMIGHSTIYKWTDENGKVHYTQRPAPDGKNAKDIEKEIRFAADLPTSGTTYKPDKPKKSKYKNPEAKESKPSPKDDNTPAKQENDKAYEEYQKKLADYCKKQNDNLTALKSDSPIAWEDNGQTKLLSDEDRSQKVSDIQTSLKENCTPEKLKPKASSDDQSDETSKKE